MPDTSENGNIEESLVESESKIDIEETSVNLNYVKNEPNEEAFEEDTIQYRITLEYENLFGIINEVYDNLIGFENNDVIMENAMIKLEPIKEEDELRSFYCSKCKGVYKGYCLKCSTLLRILNNTTLKNPETASNTIPKDILEIRETSKGNAVYLLRSIPKNVIFGPFEGISGSTFGHSWKIIDNKLSNVEYGNWMKNIACAPSASTKNLNIFQSDGNLYFQTNREIGEGEELLIYYDDEELKSLDNSEECLYNPRNCEKLSKIFACTFCCFGSNSCLMEHKKKSCWVKHSSSIKDFVLVECHYCKMWLEKWEYEEYHVTHCLEKHRRMCSGNHEIHSNESAPMEPSNNKQIQNTIETKNKNYFQKNNKHKGNKQHQCDICKNKFTRKSYLNQHMKCKHRGDESAKDYKCPECPYQTNHKSTFQDHFDRHRGIKPFECGICMKKFNRKNTMKTHIINKHIGDGSAKDYQCLECPYQTNDKGNLKKHLDKHRGIKPFECDICMAKFKRKNNMKTHIINKHIGNKHVVDRNPKIHKCSECTYQTNYKRSLQRHLQKHKGITFTCNICTAKFARRDILKRHVRDIHADDEKWKGYKCSECPYRTMYKNNFQQHLNKHRGIKPFECAVCTLKFTQKTNLKIHIQNKHAVDGSAKGYKCSQCSYRTNYKCSLKRHIKSKHA